MTECERCRWQDIIMSGVVGGGFIGIWIAGLFFPDNHIYNGIFTIVGAGFGVLLMWKLNQKPAKKRKR